MRKILLYSSALVLGLSGAAESACIQTPSCSSLGYTSSSSCTGGVKCPFGNAWNCTGPNNTTKINSINTSITNILNRITKLENNSGSSSGSGSGSGTSSLCDSCNVGDFICGGKCYAPSVVTSGGKLASDCTYYVTKKENGKCSRISTTGADYRDVSVAELLQGNVNTYYSVLQEFCRLGVIKGGGISSMRALYLGNEWEFYYTTFTYDYLSESCNSTKKYAYDSDCKSSDINYCVNNPTGFFAYKFRIPVESTF